MTYTGWYNPVDELDTSVLPNMPIPGEEYTILVPKTDSDGNSISGIRTPDVQVPIATYTGWALRRAPFAGNEDCALTGQYIPFPVTKAQRLATGDPRLSVEERYGSIGNYNYRYAVAVKQDDGGQDPAGGGRRGDGRCSGRAGSPAAARPAYEPGRLRGARDDADVLLAVLVADATARW